MASRRRAGCPGQHDALGPEFVQLLRSATAASGRIWSRRCSRPPGGVGLSEHHHRLALLLQGLAILACPLHPGRRPGSVPAAARGAVDATLNPMPGRARSAWAAARLRPRSPAAATIALPAGDGEPCSMVAARASNASAPVVQGDDVGQLQLAQRQVPVLSNATVSMWARRPGRAP